MEVVPEHVNLGLIMRDTLLEYRTSYEKPYFVMIFQNSDILRPTFALISPGATFNVATVRDHVLQPLNPTKNDFNYTQVKVPKGKLCQQKRSQLPKIAHTVNSLRSYMCSLPSNCPGGIVNDSVVRNR
jgi:hypothetical protein